MEKQKRKLIKHAEHCLWKMVDQARSTYPFSKRKKTYYFKKQIEVATRLYKKLK